MRSDFFHSRIALWIIWGTAFLGSLMLVFPITADVGSDIAFSVLGIFLWRSDLERLQKLLFISAGVGLALSCFPFDPLRAFADGMIAFAVLSVLIAFLRRAWAFLRSRQSMRPFLTRSTARMRSWIASCDPIAARRLSMGIPLLALLFALGSSVLGGASGAPSSLVGVSDGASLWNSVFLAGPLRREGSFLHDDRFVVQGTTPRVGIVDSPFLTLLKMGHPAPLPGGLVMNVFMAFNAFAFFFSATYFIYRFTGSFVGALLAVMAAFSLTPLLSQVSFSAPFDFWPALLIVSCAVRRKSSWLIAAAAVSAFFNVACGYEFALLVFFAALCGRLPYGTACMIGASGVLGSVLSASLSRFLAPDMTTFAVWWSTNDVLKIARATGVDSSWIGSAFIALALIVSWGFALRVRNAMLRALFPALLAALVLSMPPLLGGVPLLVPSLALQHLALGWPSARILQSAILFLVMPAAFSVQFLLDRYCADMRVAMRLASVVIVTGCVFMSTRLVSPRSATPFLSHQRVVLELPLVEPNSEAGVIYADDLLRGDERIVQAVPYVTTVPLVPLTADIPAVLRLIEGIPGPEEIVLRDDVYAHPSLRYAEPTIFDPSDTIVPNLDRNPALALALLTEDAQIYVMRGR